MKIWKLVYDEPADGRQQVADQAHEYETAQGYETIQE
jgi:hypothetical protein